MESKGCTYCYGYINGKNGRGLLGRFYHNARLPKEHSLPGFPADDPSQPNTYMLYETDVEHFCFHCGQPLTQEAIEQTEKLIKAESNNLVLKISAESLGDTTRQMIAKIIEAKLPKPEGLTIDEAISKITEISEKSGWREKNPNLMADLFKLPNYLDAIYGYLSDEAKIDYYHKHCTIPFEERGQCATLGKKCDECEYQDSAGIPTELAHIVLCIMEICGEYDIDLSKIIEDRLRWFSAHKIERLGSYDVVD